MQYDIIIVLCPESKDKDGKFPEFKDGKYLGGQTRMDAAVDLFKNNQSAEFIVAGGYDKRSEESKKVSDMEDFLKERCNEIKLRCIKSLPCTYHNFVAIFNTWKQIGWNLENKRIGLLTNFYHLPRAMRFAVKAKISTKCFGISDLIPISAESIVRDLAMHNMYTRLMEYVLRLDSERMGMRDLEIGSYADNCLKKNYDEFIQIAKKHKEILLTEKERNEIDKDDSRK